MCFPFYHNFFHGDYHFGFFRVQDLCSSDFLGSSWFEKEVSGVDGGRWDLGIRDQRGVELKRVLHGLTGLECSKGASEVHIGLWDFGRFGCGGLRFWGGQRSEF